MNNLVPPCTCERHTQPHRLALTELRLQLLQRKMFRRPYNALVIDRKLIQEKFKIRELYQSEINLISSFIRKHEVNHLEMKYYSFRELSMREFIMSCNNLTTLHLVSVDLEPNSLKVLADYSQEFQLKVLYLSENKLTNDHITHLQNFLRGNKTLQYLDLGYCDLTIDTFVSIADSVFNSESIIGINFSRIVPRHELEIVDTIKIGFIMGSLINKLKEIRLRNCGLSGHDIEPIIEYVAQPSILTRLDLAANNIGSYGTEKLIEAIAIGVQFGNKLWALDVSSNNLGEYGGRAFGMMLSKTKIRYLDVSFNKIPSKEINLILKMIRKAYDLKVLKIWGNTFDQESADCVNRYIQGTKITSNAIDIAVTYDCDEQKLRVIPSPTNISFPVPFTDIKSLEKKVETQLNHANKTDKSLCKEPVLKKLTKHEEFQCQMNVLKEVYFKPTNCQ